MDSLTISRGGYNLINDFLINHSSTSHVSDDADDVHRLRLRLEYFFMDPFRKWKRRKTKPWKLLVQVIKLIFFTYQLILFGSDMAKYITYQDEMQTTLKLLLLKDWQPGADALAYPGPYVPYAVYTQQAFLDYINFSIKAYSRITKTSVGPFGFPTKDPNTVPPIYVNVTDLIQAQFDPSQFEYNYNMLSNESVTKIEFSDPPGGAKWENFNISEHVQFNFSTMISTIIDLPLRSLLIEDASSGDQGIVCFEVDNRIVLDNRHRDGQIIMDLVPTPRRATCHGSIHDISHYMISRRVINIVVMCLAIVSCALCIRSLWRAYWLIRCTELVLKARSKALTREDKFEFCDGWLILIIINDVMIAIATAIMSFYNERLLETNNYTICSLLLGMGNLLSWAGLLRYLSFFKQYNILLLTLKKSFAHVMRFMFCTTLIYW